jgi:hypothetical protein
MPSLGQDLAGKPDKEAREIFHSNKLYLLLLCVSYLYAMLHHGRGGEMLMKMWDILYIRRIFSECSVSPDNSFIDRRESS